MRMQLPKGIPGSWTLSGPASSLSPTAAPWPLHAHPSVDGKPMPSPSWKPLSERGGSAAAAAAAAAAGAPVPWLAGRVGWRDVAGWTPLHCAVAQHVAYSSSQRAQQQAAQQHHHPHPAPPAPPPRPPLPPAPAPPPPPAAGTDGADGDAARAALLERALPKRATPFLAAPFLDQLGDLPPAAAPALDLDAVLHAEGFGLDEGLGGGAAKAASAGAVGPGGVRGLPDPPRSRSVHAPLVPLPPPVQQPLQPQQQSEQAGSQVPSTDGGEAAPKLPPAVVSGGAEAGRKLEPAGGGSLGVRRHTAVVRVLLELGADPGHANALDDTPLHMAARAGDEPVLHLLLDAAVRRAEEALALQAWQRGGGEGLGLSPGMALGFTGRTPLAAAITSSSKPAVVQACVRACLRVRAMVAAARRRGAAQAPLGLSAAASMSGGGSGSSGPAPSCASSFANTTAMGSVRASPD